MVTFWNRKFLWVVGILLLIPLSSLLAQQRKYSLQDFVDSATRHLPVLLQKQALVNGAKAAIADTRHVFLPTLNTIDEINVASANSLPGAYMSFGVIPSVSSSVRAENNYQAATGDIAILYSQYQLVTFGQRSAAVRQAQAAAGLQQADLDMEAYLIKAQISRLYFAILTNQYQLAVETQNIRRYLSIDTVIRALTNTGLRAGVDSSLALAELSKARVAYNKRLGALDQLTTQLAFLTGIPATQAGIDTTGRDNALPITMLLKGPHDSLANPLIGLYLKQKEYAESGEALARKSYLPKIFLTGGAWGRGSSIEYNDTYKSLGTGLGYQRFNYMLGLTFSYDLFDPIHRKDKIAEEHFQVQASDLAQQQQQLSLNSSAAQAMAAIRTAENNLHEIPIQLGAATDAYRQKMAQYKAGIINLVDLTDASYVLYTAQISYAETINDWFLANLDRATATGSLDQFIQLIK
jgi:outer membrane protein TolC